MFFFDSKIVITISLLFFFTLCVFSLKKKDSVTENFRLIEKKQVSLDSYIFKFEPLKKTESLSFEEGEYLVLSLSVNGENIKRKYTPISPTNQLDFIDLLIKIYSDGSFTPHLNLLKIDDKVLISKGKSRYNFIENLKTKIGMIAGGTGIAPFYRILLNSLQKSDNKIKFFLVFANEEKENLYFFDEFNQLAKKYPDFFKVHYVLKNPPKDWNYGTGLVTEEIIEKYLPPRNSDTKLFLCGSPRMITFLKKFDRINIPKIDPVLKNNDNVFIF